MELKAKIVAALKTKYSDLGFKPKVLEGLAASLEKSVTDESQIEAAVNGLEETLRVFQADYDRNRAEYNALKSQYEELKAKSEASSAKGGEQGNKSEPEKTFDAEAFKAELLKEIREEQAAATKQSQQAAQRNAEIASKAKEFGIPEKFVSKLSIAQDADLDDYFKGVKQDLIDAGFEFSEPPTQGGGVTENGNDIAKLIDAGTEQIVKSKNK